MVKHEFNNAVPIYLQLMDYFRTEILSGRLNSGQKMATVRDLALTFSINPNTVQRALYELESENLLFSQRTAGRFVTNEKDYIKQLRKKIAKEKSTEFLKEM